VLMRAHQHGTFVANGAIAERSALGAAGYDSDVLRHREILNCGN
jgi:hypothetical protein